MKFLRMFLALAAVPAVALAAEAPLPQQAAAAMRKAAGFFHDKAAVRGGYVYYYSPDLAQRLGEGRATPTQIWVQPPGTPSVGLAYLQAFAATGDNFYREAARAAAEALIYGQLASGGWTHVIDFDPASKRGAQYRNGRSRGKNYSTFDDGSSQTALRLLMQTDRALGFAHREIHEAAEFARRAVLAAQFPSGGFPQGWTGPVAPHAAVKASYPDYEWRTENRIKDYWDLPTLNDGLAGQMAGALAEAAEIYKHTPSLAALKKLGDFLLLAQMPDPQPAWAQQYDTKMRPVWARKFEPPAIASRESLDAIEALIRIHRVTGDAKYLEPAPRALAYLKRSLLPDGQLARYYELQSNKPLYMTADYQLTHDDADAPQHYGWKDESRIAAVEAAFLAAQSKTPITDQPRGEVAIRQIIADLDAEGRWISIYKDQRLIGQPKFKAGEPFIASEVFAKNLETLSNYIASTRAKPAR